MFRLLATGVLALALPMAALAGALVESVRGTVEAGGAPLSQGQRVFPGTNITAAPGSQLLLRFDDGMQLVLDGDSFVRLLDFRYQKGGPNDRVVLEVLRGATRVLTGEIARTNPKQFFLRTQQAQFGLHGPADFTIALVNPAYLSVAHGTVLASNGAGTFAFSAGATASIASNAAAAVAIPASAFPPVASSAIGNLAAASVAPVAGGASTGAAVAGSAARANIVLPGLVIGVAAAVAAAIVANHGGGNRSTPQH